MPSLRGLLAAAALGLALAMPAQLAFAQALTGEQKTEIQGLIKSYLIEHPEVLNDALGALGKYREAQDSKERAKAAGEVVASPDGIVIGNPQGKVTLAEFFDYNCGYCRQAIPDMARLMKDNPDLRVMLFDFPILTPASVDAAIVAEAARRQLPGDKFWQYHSTLLGHKGLNDKEQALAVAKDMGLDMKQLEKDAADPSIRAKLEASDKYAKELKLNGTPSYVVGDDVQIGRAGYDQLQAEVNNVRKCGKAACS